MVFAAVDNIFSFFCCQVQQVLFVLFDFLKRLLVLVHHLINLYKSTKYRNIVEMFFLAKNFFFVVFETVHQLDTIIFVRKVLNALYHASSEIVI